MVVVKFLRREISETEIGEQIPPQPPNTFILVPSCPSTMGFPMHWTQPLFPLNPMCPHSANWASPYPHPHVQLSISFPPCFFSHRSKSHTKADGLNLPTSVEREEKKMVCNRWSEKSPCFQDNLLSRCQTKPPQPPPETTEQKHRPPKSPKEKLLPKDSSSTSVTRRRRSGRWMNGAREICTR